jgi:hypothetical protein
MDKASGSKQSRRHAVSRERRQALADRSSDAHEPPQDSNEWVANVRVLPYRPLFKLARAKDEPIERFEGGLTVTTFRDDRGNLYQRERDGQWERWWLVLDRRNPGGLTLYKADLTKAEPDEHGDCEDRIDDLRFAAKALNGLIDDARERKLLGAADLDALDELVARLRRRIELVLPAIPEAPPSAGRVASR